MLILANSLVSAKAAQRGTDTISPASCVAPYLSLGNFERIPADCKLGMMGETTMSAFEAVILSLVIVWTPGMAFVAYLLMPRRLETD